MKLHRALPRLMLLAAILVCAFGPNQVIGEVSKHRGKADPAAAFEKWRARIVTQDQREAAAKRLAEKVAAKRATGAQRASATTLDEPQVGQGDMPDYFSPTVPNWNYTPKLRKFVDALPGLGSASANGLGQYIPVAIPDQQSYPGIDPGVNSDYYEIALVQYEEKLHSDLPPTTLRGYVQIDTPAIPDLPTRVALQYPDGSPILDAQGNQVYAVDRPHYMGPMIIARRDVPVRLKFTNYLPRDAGGDFFIPVDPSVMGAGMGPHMVMPHMVTAMGKTATVMTMEPHELTVGRKLTFENFLPRAYNGVFRVKSVLSATQFQVELMKAPGGPPTRLGEVMEAYTDNRAVVHLHGGRTPWISDGTPHQWITPAGENTSYPQGVSVVPVPDMSDVDPGDPRDGSMTYYYTNQQSARLMFYHDHVYGITRLNVYAGEASGYMITDPVEQSLIGKGLIPQDQIPLIIQDKTFVDAETIGTLDPTWRWGTGPDADGNGYRDYKTGDLWVPHVYVPAQNPYDLSGMTAMGRWHYGPWFWPPTNGISHPPIPNPYYDPDRWPWQPPEIPDVPDPSMGMEAFNDTPLVNGTAYPTVTVQPKAYRFRILNAANDRFLNLQLYEADPDTVTDDGRTHTEVKMIPAIPRPEDPTWPQDFEEGNETWPVDGREGGVPDWRTRGPDWIQIGSEGGFLPMPTVVRQRPVDWNVDVTMFNAGIVNSGSVILGPAERADVIVDFSKYAGKTLILYNDAPAAFPAPDPRYDYYTGMPDMTDTGGHFPTEAGYGPNTRTIMQIKVADAAPAPEFDLEALNAAWESTGTEDGVFKQAQDPIIVAQGEIKPGYDQYNRAYNATFPNKWPNWGISRIHDTSLSFRTVDGNTVTIPLEAKAIQDEMGETFDDYGRMAGKLGLQLPTPQPGGQTFVMQGYIDPATEVITASMTPLTPPLAADGTQIWKITHNGVDTHPIHFHLFDVQLLNRVAWDNSISLPSANEMGWKETIRVSPLEDTIVALRPVLPRMPFKLPDSIRPLDPAQPIGGTKMFTNIDPFTGDAMEGGETPDPIVNKLVNFGWEYMWHCHILSHEEMEMMRPVSFMVSPAPASSVTADAAPGPSVNLRWTNNRGVPNPMYRPETTLQLPAATNFVVQRAVDSAFTEEVTTFEVAKDPKSPYADQEMVAFTDTTVAEGVQYFYRIRAETDYGYSTWSDAASATVPGGMMLGQMRVSAPDQALVRVDGAVVTGVFPNAGAFYVQQPNGVAGIRVQIQQSAQAADARVAAVALPTVGQVVAVQGKVTTANGERQIVASEFTRLGSTSALEPVMLAVRGIGGGPVGLAPGMTGMIGLNNVGLLLRTAGTVVSRDDSDFTLTDGSGTIRVILPSGVTPPSEGQMVAVTGVCSVETGASGRYPVLLARKLADIQVLSGIGIGDVITEWNSISVNAIKAAGLTSTVASRALAMVHCAVYDSVNSIVGTHQPYRMGVSGKAEASKEAAAAAAAHRVLVGLFPSQSAALDTALAESLSSVPNGSKKDDGVSLGRDIADAMLAWRGADHSDDMMAYMGGMEPGQWRPTPPYYMMGMMPLWGTVTPFAMTSGTQFRLAPPPPLSSPEYAQALNEAKDIGAKASASRSPQQTEIAYFWADSPGTITTVGRWNAVARQAAIARGNNLEENARLFAILNVALADAGISAWDSKYYYALWRPITAIREAGADGNPLTDADPAWLPELMTPAFPEYASAHSTFSGAGAEVLNRCLGTDNSAISIASFDNPTAYRYYTSFTQVADEAGISRIYGGIHYGFSNILGIAAGRSIGGYVCDNLFLPN